MLLRFSFYTTLFPGLRLLLLCQMPSVSKNKLYSPPPVLLPLLYFNQVAGKILEKVDGLMFPHDNIYVRPPGIFYDL